MKAQYISLLVGTILLIGCDAGDPVEVKKNELTAAKAELFSIKEKIIKLEAELEALGVNEINTNLTLVTTHKVTTGPFVHKVDVRGTVQSKNNVLISAETPAAVQEILVVEGQQVKKGQLLIIQDGEILRKNIKELESSLELATTMYNRQAKLWEQNIGTEVQYLEMKNRKESLELKLSTTKSQLDKTRIKAPFEGIVDKIDVRLGEMAQPGFPILRLVSMSNMYIKADVSESFVGKFSKGQPVEIYLPSTDYRLKSSIKAIGMVINPNNRTFELEVALPNNLQVKPNMIVVLSLADYKNDAALTVPTKIIQSDRLGNFVYKIAENEGKTVVDRVDITLGITYENETEITAGLTDGDLLVVKGGLGLAEGGEIKIVEE